MTVAQLIALLQEQDADKQVFIHGWPRSGWPLFEPLPIEVNVVEEGSDVWLEPGD